MRPNEKHRLRCTDCGAIQIVGPRLRRLPVCPECYSTRYVRVEQPEPSKSSKEEPVTSPAAVSQDLEYYSPNQKYIRGHARKFSNRFQTFVISLNPEQLQSLGAMPGDIICLLGKLDRLLEGLGLPFEYQQESR
jgi:hypothetical protein